MKNRYVAVAIVLITTTILFFSGCRARRNRVPEIEKGVVINGVRWAAYNVDSIGTFVNNPKNAGMLFQWNRLKAWSAGDEAAEDWDYSTPSGTEWETPNNPCPVGWRLPTGEELESLKKADNEWTTLNGVYGRIFGTAPYQLFLPAVGWRSGNDGVFDDFGTKGYYWSSEQSDDESATYLWFNYEDIGVDWDWRGDGFSVRCVAEEVRYDN